MNGHVPTYIVGMDKYSGCNVVDSAVYAQKSAPPRRSAGYVWVLARLIVAAVLIGAVCAVRYIPESVLSFAPRLREVFAQVLCYDVFGRTDIGAFPLISQIIEAVA